MPVPAAAAVESKLPFLICGAIGGYLLVMCTNPVRASLRDGLRAIRRYSALWFTLGVFGFCYQIWDLAQRVYLHAVLPPSERPTFAWARDAWRDPNLWLAGSPQSLWYLPRAEFLDALSDARLLALESVAGLFNNLVITFPVSAIAAVLLLTNWEGHQGVLLRALRKRFSHFGWLIHLCIVLCGLAALAKPFMYAVPQVLVTNGAGPRAQELWFLWSPVIAWLSGLFEYLFGVCIQIYLILLAYAWVRGITFTHSHLLDFAIRRFSYVVKWAAVVMVLSSIFIEAPLVLKNFAAFADRFPETQVFESRSMVRAWFSAFLLLTATTQIMLTFHSESLIGALRDHFRFVARNAWPFSWFLLLAAFHLYAVHVLDLSIRRGLGEGTALWVAWTLVFPWIAAAVAAWLLASWVCVFKRCDTGRAAHENWIRF